MSTQTYRIPAVNLPRLEAEITKLNKKAEKLDTPPLALNILETESVKRKDPVFGFEYTDVYHLCAIEGESPKLEGWTLVACIAPLGNENLIREVPGERCPEMYRTTDMHCDHCYTNRKRNDVFVLRNDFMEYKQVGRTCISDFLGHASPEAMLGRAEYMMNIGSVVREAAEYGWGFAGVKVVPTQQFLAVVSIISRRVGYVSRKKSGELARATSDVAWDVCAMPREKSVQKFIQMHDIQCEDRDTQLAWDAIEWAKGFTPENAPNNYLHNIGVICRREIISFDQAGWAASTISAYQRYLEDEMKKVDALSQHVGEVGKRQSFSSLIILMTHPYDTAYGVTTLVKFQDTNANILVWRASGNPDWLQVGATVDVKATVDKHDEFNGVPETVLKRVKPIERIENAVKKQGKQLWRHI